VGPRPDQRADGGVAEAQLLRQLAGQGGALVLAVLDAAARGRPHHGVVEAGRELEPHQQDAVVLVEDDGAHRLPQMEPVVHPAIMLRRHPAGTTVADSRPAWQRRLRAAAPVDGRPSP